MGNISINNKYTNKLIVYDSDYAKGNKYASITGEIDASIYRYINALRNLAKNSKGNYAQNIINYADTVEFLLSHTVYGIGSKFEHAILSYVSEIDAADDKLY